MTLAVALLAGGPPGADPGPDLDALDLTCRHLLRAVPDTVPLLLIDAGGTDGVAARLAAAAEGAGHARSVAVDRPDCTPASACALVRQLTGCAHVLPLVPGERLAAGAAAALADWLARRDPALALLGGGFHLAEGAAALPYPDAERPGAAPLARTPDPRRLLPAGGCAPRRDPFADPGPAWDAWQEALGDGAAAEVFDAPVVLRPLPRAGATPALELLRDRLLATPRSARAALLERLAPWAGDALAMAPAGAAFDTTAALPALRAALPRALRRRAGTLPGPLGALLRAGSEGEALAVLALLCAARQDRIGLALAAGQDRLRADLDLALPGPEYLADLYARVRGL